MYLSDLCLVCSSPILKLVLLETIHHIALKQHVQDASFNNTAASNCYLSVLIEKNTVSYTITRGSDQEVILLRVYELEGIDSSEAAYRSAICDFLEQESIFEQIFDRVIVALNTNKFTLVPSGLLDQEDFAAVYAFNLPLDKGAKLLVDTLDTLSVDIVYSIHEQLARQIQLVFGKNNFELKHAANFMLPILSRMNVANHYGKTSYIAIGEREVQIACFQDADLLLYNTFAYQTNEDMLYYIINASHQMGLSLEEDHFIIYGEIEAGDVRHQLLEPYISHLELGQRPANKMYCTALDKISENQHLGLFCIK